MVQDIKYHTISLVIESWELLRRKKNYEEIAGSRLFRNLFEKCPPAKVLFGFPLEMDPNDPHICTSEPFLRHASYMIRTLDAALNLLGPDFELLTEILVDLGKKHVKYGVRSDMFPVMGESIIAMLEELLQDTFTPAIREAWLETYVALSTDMLRAQTNSVPPVHGPMSTATAFN